METTLHSKKEVRFIKKFQGIIQSVDGLFAEKEKNEFLLKSTNGSGLIKPELIFTGHKHEIRDSFIESYFSSRSFSLELKAKTWVKLLNFPPGTSIEELMSKGREENLQLATLVELLIFRKNFPEICQQFNIVLPQVAVYDESGLFQLAPYINAKHAENQFGLICVNYDEWPDNYRFLFISETT